MLDEIRFLKRDKDGNLDAKKFSTSHVLELMSVSAFCLKVVDGEIKQL